MCIRDRAKAVAEQKARENAEKEEKDAE